MVIAPTSVAPWGDWWRENSERVRVQFSRQDYLRLKFRAVDAAHDILVERGFLVEPTIAPHLRSLTDQHGDLLTRFPALGEYFQQLDTTDLRNKEEVQVNLLPFDKCVNLTEDYAFIDPLFQVPELVQFLILDEPNTSDHHCFTFGLPYPGSVHFVPHDDVSRIAFRSLNDFLAAVQSAISTRRRLTDFHMKEVLLCPDQVSLNAAIQKGLQTDDSIVVSLLIHSSDLRAHAFFNEIIGNVNWTYAEEIANRIVAKPEPHMRQLAAQIAQHDLARVAERGRLALKLIDALPPS